MRTIACVFGVVVAFKLAINLMRYIQCRRYLTRYLSHVRNPDWSIEREHHNAVRLLKGAGLEDATVTDVQFVGFGQLQIAHPSVFDNLEIRRTDVASITVKLLNRALGTYQSRAIESLNPLYWMEVLIFLPRTVLSYLGAAPETVLAKTLQAAYWALTTLAAIVYAVYQPNVATLVRRVLDPIIRRFSAGP